jgi:hypothetical protein
MALRNDEKEWVQEAINTAIDKIRPHGWRKLVVSLRELGPLAASIAVVLTLLGITLTSVYQAVSNVREETTFRTRTGDRLDSIEGTLKLMQAQAAAARYSALPPQELKTHRDELQTVVKNLATVPRDAPNFWPTSFQMISLLSQSSSDVEPTNNKELEFNNSSGPVDITPGSRVFLSGLITNMVFKDEVVRFDPSVRLSNVTFYNCVFIFPAIQTPARPLEEIVDALLSGNLNTTITAS